MCFTGRGSQLVHMDGCKNQIGILDEILDDKLFYLADFDCEQSCAKRNKGLLCYFRWSFGWSCDKSAR